MKDGQLSPEAKKLLTQLKDNLGEDMHAWLDKISKGPKS